MNIVFTPTDGITSRFIQEEYIPLTFSFNDKDYVKHIGFYYGDTDLCEFGIDPETNEIIKFVLTCSSHYEFINDKMTVKKGENGLIKLMLPPIIDCSDFKVSVYSDGVHICRTWRNRGRQRFRVSRCPFFPWHICLQGF